MKIFIDSNIIKIKKKNTISRRKQFHVDYSSILDKNITSGKYKNICIRNVTNKEVYKFITTLLIEKNNISDTIFTLEVNKKIKIIEIMRKKKSYIKAGGGVVQKDNSLLFIYKLGKWDLPKGKVEKKEGIKETAMREVEEECFIKIQNPKKICATFHLYTIQQKPILKKTTWYAMDLLDDTYMKPQKSEGIELIRWVDSLEIKKTLEESYNSIKYVIKKYNAYKK